MKFLFFFEFRFISDIFFVVLLFYYLCQSPGRVVGQGPDPQDRAGLDGHPGGPRLVARRGPGVDAAVAYPRPEFLLPWWDVDELDGDSGALEGTAQVSSRSEELVRERV